MKRLILTGFLSILFVILIHAQEMAGTTGVVINYKGYQNKLEKSDETIQDPKKNIDPKTWLARGVLLDEIYNIHTKYLRKDMPVSELKLFFPNPKETKTTEDGLEEYVYEGFTIYFKDGKATDWVETAKIHENPLPEAKAAYLKAIELDKENKLSSKIKEGLIALKGSFENEAISCYNKKNFSNAFDNFKNILDINDIQLMGGIVDTVIYYTTGRAAKEAGKNDIAAEYFKKAVELNYDDPYLYYYANENYLILGDTLASVEMLKRGFEKYPENQSIQIALINYYLMRGEGEVALDYLRVAMKIDSMNVSFIFAEGTIYDKMGRTDEAIATYEKCLAIDPEYFNGNYNLGVVHFNRAVKIVEECQKIEDIKEYEACLKRAEGEIYVAIPYMEKAKEVADSSQICDTLDTLKTLYYRTQQEDKRQAVLDEIASNGCQ